MTVLTWILVAAVVGGLLLAAVCLLFVLGGFFLARLVEALVPLGLLVWFLLHGRKNGRGWDKLEGVRYAHRGWHDKPAVPENSLPAFRRAAEAGYGAELDVHLTKDGRLAVVHDSDLQRVCGQSGIVEDLTAAELAAYRLEETEETIPFLEEVLPLFEDKAPLVVEVKPNRGNHDVLTRTTMECLDRFRADYCVESFDPQVLVWLRRNRPEVLRGQLSQSYWKQPEGRSVWRRLALTQLLFNVVTRPDFVAYRFEDRKNVSVALCRWMGVRTMFWTIRSMEELLTAEAEGALPIFERFDPKEETHL